MKILIGFILALFISSNAYAQSPAEILGNGKVVSAQLLDGTTTFHDMVVVYNNAVYKCATEIEGNPSAGQIDHAVSFGSSQCGRFLRQYLHTGMNSDEKNRKAMDGVIAHVGGGMRGEFNLRFGQPSKDVCYIMPELFPFTDLKQRDPLTGDEGGLLDLMVEQGDQGNMPKMMFTNSSGEYWKS